jgi:hypothetical protein
MSSNQALCLAEGLAEQGLETSFVDAWAFGTEADPFADDSRLAKAMLSYANVCLPDDAFSWYGVDLPGDEEIRAFGGEDSEDTGEDLPGSAGRAQAEENSDEDTGAQTDQESDTNTESDTESDADAEAGS